MLFNFAGTNVRKHQLTLIIRGVLTPFVQDAVKYLIGRAISILGILGHWVFWPRIFWTLGILALGILGLWVFWVWVLWGGTALRFTRGYKFETIVSNFLFNSVSGFALI